MASANSVKKWTEYDGSIVVGGSNGKKENLDCRR